MAALANLGQAIAQTGRDYFGMKLEERDRQQRLEDEARRRQDMLNDRDNERNYMRKTREGALAMEKQKLLDLPELEFRGRAKAYGMDDALTAPLAELRARVENMSLEEAERRIQHEADARLRADETNVDRHIALDNRKNAGPRAIAEGNVANARAQYDAASRALSAVQTEVERELRALPQRMVAEYFAGKNMPAELRKLGLKIDASPEEVIAKDMILAGQLTARQEQIIKAGQAKAADAKAIRDREGGILASAAANVFRHDGSLPAASPTDYYGPQKPPPDTGSGTGLGGLGLGDQTPLTDVPEEPAPPGAPGVSRSRPGHGVSHPAYFGPGWTGSSAPAVVLPGDGRPTPPPARSSGTLPARALERAGHGLKNVWWNLTNPASMRRREAPSPTPPYFGRQ